MFHSAGQIAQNAAGIQVHATIVNNRQKRYRCLSCNQKVFLRQGRKILKSGQPMTDHFAHSVKNVIKCSGYSGGEGIQHIAAKKCLADHIEKFRFIDQSCDSCDTPNPHYCFRFSKESWRIIVEGPIKGTGTGTKQRRADILIELKTKTDCIRLKPWYSIEVRHSHAVSMEKTQELHSVDCGIFEVLASDVLQFKDMLQDKPFYIRNVHSLCRVPWTCKTCMEVFSNERISRWLDYEEWYGYQWAYQDKLILETMSNEARLLKRKILQSRTFKSIECRNVIKFISEHKIFKVKCLDCREWIFHKYFHTFHASSPNIENEPWWHDAIRTDSFLARSNFKVTRQNYCDNCVHKCSNCGISRPLSVLRKYGLCMRCNTNDNWFDTRETLRLNTTHTYSDSDL